MSTCGSGGARGLTRPKDTEKYPKIASKFNVEALPTVLLFKGGEVVDRIEGMLDANQLQTRLNYFLSSP